MCLASSEPGGPRRCSGDTRSCYQRRQATLDNIEHTHDRLRATLNRNDALDAYVAAHQLPPAERDQYLADLKPTDTEDLARALNAHIAPAVDIALGATADPELSANARDLTVKAPGEIPIGRPGEPDTIVNGYVLDANTAIYRTGNGRYAVAYRAGDTYTPIAVASTYKAAIAMANRIPVLTELDPPAEQPR